jgi:hypothetical protein
MSGRVSNRFVDFTRFSFDFDCVRCALQRSFLVRNWVRFAHFEQPESHGLLRSCGVWVCPMMDWSENLASMPNCRPILCRKLAASAVNQPDKEAWLRLAADWIKLAENAEERPRSWLRQ